MAPTATTKQHLSHLPQQGPLALSIFLPIYINKYVLEARKVLNRHQSTLFYFLLYIFLDFCIIFHCYEHGLFCRIKTISIRERVSKAQEKAMSSSLGRVGCWQPQLTSGQAGWYQLLCPHRLQVQQEDL